MSDSFITNCEIIPGIKLLVDEMPHSSSVSVGLFFPVGSGFEKNDERGLSHFVEHMVFKGAGELSSIELSRAIDRVGGFLNAYTDRDSVCLYCQLPSENASIALNILLDMVYRPRFSEELFIREKDIIINEISAADDDLEDSGQDEFFAMCYEGHAYSRKIAGREKDIESLTYNKFLDFYNEHFFSGQMIISIAGNIKNFDLVSFITNKIPNAKRLSFTKKPNSNLVPLIWHKSRRMVKASGSQIYFFSGISFNKISEENFWLMNTANSAYGESMSSRLFMKIREEKGLCYNISSNASISMFESFWGVIASTMPEQLIKFIEEYKNESEKLYKDGLLDIEINEAMSRQKGLLSIASDEAEFRMKRMARSFMCTGECDTIEKSKERFSPGGSVTIDRINNMIKSTFNPENESILLYGKLGIKNIKAGKKYFGAELDNAKESISNE